MSSRALKQLLMDALGFLEVSVGLSQGSRSITPKDMAVPGAVRNPSSSLCLLCLREPCQKRSRLFTGGF